MKDHQIRHHVIVPDDFALLFPVVLANDTLAAERDLLHKAIPRFGGIGCRMDGPPHLLIAHKAESGVSLLCQLFTI